MGKLTLMFDALRKGSSLSDPQAWKNRAAAVVELSQHRRRPDADPARGSGGRRGRGGASAR